MNPLHHDVEHTLSATVRRMRTALLRALASLALTDRRHAACAITTTDGQVVSIDNPSRLGIVREVVRSVLTYFDGTLDEGDIILTNDPFSGGSHIQDVTLVKPLFGVGQLVGYGIVQAHLADLGGMALGGYYPFAREIWAEGVRVTPTRLYRSGVLQRDSLTMLTLNSRLPQLVVKDLEAMQAALEVCQVSVAELTARATPEDYRQALQTSLDATATRVQAQVQTYPPGVWVGEDAPVHCCLEEAELRVRVRLAIADGGITLDFSDSSAPAPGFVNTTAATATAAALTPFLCLWRPVAVNDGLFRHLSCVIPDTTFLGAKLPMSVGWSPYQPSLEIVRVVNAALTQLPGISPSGNLTQAGRVPVRLPFAVTGCGRHGCPFPAVPGKAEP